MVVALLIKRIPGSNPANFAINRTIYMTVIKYLKEPGNVLFKEPTMYGRFPLTATQIVLALGSGNSNSKFATIKH